jgi:hypothetical protein
VGNVIDEAKSKFLSVGLEMGYTAIYLGLPSTRESTTSVPSLNRGGCMSIGRCIGVFLRFSAVLAVFCGTAALSQVSSGASHGARLLQNANAPNARATALRGAFVYYLSVDEDYENDPYGFEVAFHNWGNARYGASLSAGYERWGDDVDLIPVRASLLIDPVPGSQLPCYLDIGLVYGFADSSTTGSLDNPVLGRSGITLEASTTSEWSVGASLHYQFDIIDSKLSSEGIERDLSWEGVVLSVSVGLAW